MGIGPVLQTVSERRGGTGAGFVGTRNTAYSKEGKGHTFFHTKVGETHRRGINVGHEAASKAGERLRKRGEGRRWREKKGS